MIRALRLPTLLVAALLLGSIAGLSATVSFDELAKASLSRIDGQLDLPGLKDKVEVLRDEWGVPHIYARNTEDLFFAQGFVAAQDRLWQMEMWRRTFEGRLAEVVGPEAFAHDRLVRLVRYRGPWDESEWGSYHPEGEVIFAAFVKGINAFIAQAGDNLPVEFKLTGVRPDPWTPETAVLRSPSRVLGTARNELTLAMRVAELGPEEANRRASPDPWRELKIPEGLDVSLITEEVRDALSGFISRPPRLELLPQYRALAHAAFSENLGAMEDSPGSNNWAIGGSLTASGRPIVANDPHRQVANPSLRYLVHLNAPGWDVIGAGEPGFPGVAIGHNGRVAWGLTIVGTDQADVFVEELNPENPNQVRWQGAWVPLEVVTETIAVKGEAPRTVELKFSRHGPIFFEDRENHRAYALRSVLQEPGTAEYLGALRLNQVSTMREFMRELAYYKAPSENMVGADVDGNIGWVAAALTPNRVGGWHGRLPVPGTGRYAWDGFRDDLPEEYNPERGWIATANNNIHPPDFDPPLFFKSGPPYRRFDRVVEVLGQSSRGTVEDSIRLQQDAYNSAAAERLHLFRGWRGGSAETERARNLIAEWDAFMQRDSAAAALYMTWEGAVRVSEVMSASGAERTALVEAGLVQAIGTLRQRQGEDWQNWRWGRIHRSEFPHQLVRAFDLPAGERSGGAGTVASTGATFRQVIELGNWDQAMVTNAPGQSGQPGSPFYGNLLVPWAAGEYFPLLYSREAVDAKTRFRLELSPSLD